MLVSFLPFLSFLQLSLYSITHNAFRLCRVRFYTFGTTFLEAAVYETELSDLAGEHISLVSVDLSVA